MPVDILRSVPPWPPASLLLLPPLNCPQTLIHTTTLNTFIGIHTQGLLFLQLSWGSTLQEVWRRSLFQLSSKNPEWLVVQQPPVGRKSLSLIKIDEVLFQMDDKLWSQFLVPPLNFWRTLSWRSSRSLCLCFSRNPEWQAFLPPPGNIVVNLAFRKFSNNVICCLTHTNVCLSCCLSRWWAHLAASRVQVDRKH